MILQPKSTALLLLLATINCVAAFTSPPSLIGHSRIPLNRWPSPPETSFRSSQNLPVVLQRQRISVAPVQTMGLFGLGTAEIVVVLVVVAFVIGPQNIGRIAASSFKQADAMKDELMKVPDEFKKGMEEGEMEARARKARPINRVVEKDDEEGRKS
jgi:Sec-independent protein translocase protein TatA